jgi:hypothetical protein
MKQIDIPESTQDHDQLNPQLWQDMHLKKPVQIALMRIAKEYLAYLNVDSPVLDLVVTGSQANYNYGPHSDLDLHIVMDYDQVNCDDANVADFFDTKRKLWREQHNIHIYGIPIELYVEDSNQPAVTNSYSLIKNTWITAPKHMTQTVDTQEVEQIALKWTRVIAKAIRTGDLDQLNKVKAMLSLYRKTALKQQGENSPGNWAFKALRNSGVVEKLMTSIRTLEDQELSI